MLNNTTGYDFYFADMSRNILFVFPITPPELSIKMGANNETVSLINDGDINILKSIQLTEIEFEATFPMRKYPYSREIYPFKDYYDVLKDFMMNKKPFRFVVSRAPKTLTTVSKGISSKAKEDRAILLAKQATELLSDLAKGKASKAQTSAQLKSLVELRKGSTGTGKSIADTVRPKWTSSNQFGSTYEDIRNGDSVVMTGYLGFWDTNIPVSLESMEIKENADDGDDVVIEFKLKQYKSYGVKFLQKTSTSTKTTTSTSADPDIRWETREKSKEKTYTIVAGDTLTIIAKKFYDDGSKWKVIYDKNKDLIEKTAKDMGKPSSQGGNYIWAGVTLVIPALE